MLVATLLLVVGFLLLIKGADWLVDGASALARRFGVSDLVIGLTIVAFGTSMPELVVNIVASLQNTADIAIGNIVGSNISNTLLILGATAIIAPVAVQKSTVLKEIPFSLLAAVTLLAMANDRFVDGYPVSELSRSDGLAFIGFFVIFLYYTFGISRVDDDENSTPDATPLWKAVLLIVLGLMLLIGGGKLAVDNATFIAQALGVSQALIGLTVVAIGTSLPELATSVVAAKRGKADIAVGNIVGSNIFNIFWILGISAIIRPLPFQPALLLDVSVVVASTVLLFLVIHTGGLHRRLFLWWKQRRDHSITRWEGGVLLASYLLYLAYITWRQ